MSLDKTVCDLCGDSNGLQEYKVEPKDESIVICSKCASSIDEPTNDKNHWHCLSDSMWSSEPAVQVTAYRLLTKLGSQDLIDMMYLEPEVLEWANEGLTTEKVEPTRDSNGTILEEGDSVSIIKDLVVKGAGFTAKQGTTVKNIHIESPEAIEGRVNGTKIVLLSKFLKKL
ncbi:MAG TPA: alkylphosphonate utilization protein [Campylobacterales bacterium]|jgi:protein PhnA|nr:alkylphosphonate utilization protein [Campylobacterales bacterium]HHH51606.1 alkylphosphonate utilization protein [Campylobacterales bacterium]